MSSPSSIALPINEIFVID